MHSYFYSGVYNPVGKAVRLFIVAMLLALVAHNALAQSNDRSVKPSSEAAMLSPDAAGEYLKAFFDSDLEGLKRILARDSRSQSILPTGEPLIIAAARYGSAEQVGVLLDNGDNANVRGPAGWSPLAAAIATRRLETVRLLLDRGADPALQAEDGTTSLQMAQAVGDAAIIVALTIALSRDLPEEERTNLIHLAAAYGDLRALKIMLPLVGNVDAADERGWTGLMYAAAGDHLEAVKLLLAAKARPNHAARNGVTPLMVAAYVKSSPVAAALLAAGANARARNEFGETAATIAVASGSSELSKLLGVQLNADALHQQLAAAAARKEYGEVKRLLDAGAPAAKPQAALSDTPAIVAAACAGESAIVKLLVERGAGLGEKDANGITPLIAGVLCNQLEAVRALVQMKAPAQEKTKGGVDAASAAIARGNAEILAALSPVAPPSVETAVQLLQRRDMKTLSLLFRSNPDLARQRDMLDLIRKAVSMNDSAILEQVLAMTDYDVNHSPEYSNGPLLFHAIETRSINSLKTLLKLGAESTKIVTDTPPYTALELAGSKGNAEALQAISQAAKKQVVSIQASLASIGYLNAAVDGSWGPSSQAALETFRKMRRLETGKNLEDALARIVGQYLRICNQTGNSFFYAFYRSKSGGMRLKGWWQLGAGQCGSIGELDGVTSYYIHAAGVAVAGSSSMLCISDDAIEEYAPEKIHPPCQPKFREAPFVKVTDTSKPFVVRQR